MAIAVMPCLFVSIVAIRWHQPVKQFRQVTSQTRFVLDRSNRASATDVENMSNTSLYHRPLNNVGYMIRNILHVLMAGGLKRKCFLVRHVTLGGFVHEVVHHFLELAFLARAEVITGNRLFCNITDTDKQ